MHSSTSSTFEPHRQALEAHLENRAVFLFCCSLALFGLNLSNHYLHYKENYSEVDQNGFLTALLTHYESWREELTSYLKEHADQEAGVKPSHYAQLFAPKCRDIWQECLTPSIGETTAHP